MNGEYTVATHYQHYALNTVFDFYLDITEASWGSMTIIDDPDIWVERIAISADNKTVFIHLCEKEKGDSIISISDSDGFEVDVYLLTDPETTAPMNLVMDYRIVTNGDEILIRCEG